MPGMNGTKSQSPPTLGSPATVAHSTRLPGGARAAFETLLTSINILSKDRVFLTIVDGLQRIPVLEEEIGRNKQENEMRMFSVKEQLDVYNADRKAFLNERNALQEHQAASKREIEALLEANRECELQEASHVVRVKELQSSIEAGNMAAQRDAKQIEGLIRAIEVERKKKIELTTLLEEQNAILSKTRDDFETCRQSHEKLRKRADWDAQRLQRAAELTTTLKHNPDT
jgi:chromosome segregation ATPase